MKLMAIKYMAKNYLLCIKLFFFMGSIYTAIAGEGWN